MARAHYVKSARKDNPVAKKGEPYWWWKPMVGGRGGAKRYSKTQPTRSQLTQSEFLSGLYDIEDGSMADAQTPEDFRDVAQALRDLGQEQQDKYDNMPDGLQQGNTGQMIEERAQNCESWADEIETAADELESELTDLEGAWQEWSDWDEQAEQNAADDADEPEEPSCTRPEGDTLEEARQALIDEKRSCFDNNPF
jgi:hypothetical protein